MVVYMYVTVEGQTAVASIAPIIIMYFIRTRSTETTTYTVTIHNYHGTHYLIIISPIPALSRAVLVDQACVDPVYVQSSGSGGTRTRNLLLQYQRRELYKPLHHHDRI